jgi:8-oxo-dGTP pyrophosphatase MutT (NUDIX family)
MGYSAEARAFRLVSYDEYLQEWAMQVARQIGALPLRREADGTQFVLLITSRDTRRWIIPKGWPWPEAEDWIAATQEAREEAGIVGRVQQDAIGSFTYEKRHPKGPMLVRVTVYLLEVAGMLEDWPEKSERERAWFTLADAARAVTEPELAALLNGLVPSASTALPSLDAPRCR